MNERECTVCPPWVVRCAHFDGRGLAITAMRYTHATFFSVHGPATEPILDNCRNCYCEHGEQAAEAEFYRREAELLGREVYA